MHKIVFLLIAILPLQLKAQQATNIRVTQEGDNVVITYDLTGGSANTKYDITVSVSTDGGRNYLITPAKITGDVKEVVTGTQKKIIWNVLADGSELSGDDIVFKITAVSDNYLNIEMVTVQGGSFQMGSTNGDSNERPVHTVYLRKFMLSKTEVTNEQWEAVMGSNPSFSKGTNLPAEDSWNNVKTFIKKLNQLTGLNYRLPTEAEWEFAARGGINSNGFTYSGSNTIDNVAWYSDNTDFVPKPVGQKIANELGLYDMSGNVEEWCSDWYGSYGYEGQTNPTGPFTGTRRVYRGGGTFTGAGNCRVTYRGYDLPERGNGFRLARSL